MRLGLGLHLRFVRLRRRLARYGRQRPRHPLMRHTVEKLHIGSGALIRPGWTNVDLDPHPGVDFAIDVRDGLPFRDAAYIYAEHFLEHLTYDEGLRFLRECRQVLRPDGALRLSTPNLDWVWATQYRVGSRTSEEATHDCFAANKAFRGWGHQFLYNLETLTETLHAAGFDTVRAFSYGESDELNLRGLEGHEAYGDAPGISHVVIVEARGVRKESLDGMRRPLDDYDSAVNP